MNKETNSTNEKYIVTREYKNEITLLEFAEKIIRMHLNSAA